MKNCTLQCCRFDQQVNNSTQMKIFKIFLQNLTIEREMIFSLVTGVVILKFNKKTIIFLGFHVCLFLVSDLLEYEMIFSIITVVKKP